MKLRNFLSLQPDYSLFTLVGPEEKIQAVKMRPSASFWKDGFKRLFKNPIAIICITVLAIIVLSAIFKETVPAGVVSIVQLVAVPVKVGLLTIPLGV